MADSEGSNCKLFVRHLPSVLSSADKIDLLKHFGAGDVVCMGRNSKMKDSAFAEFPDEVSATKALNRLHQLDILGSRLVVEYAKKHHERLASQSAHRMSSTKKEDVLDDDEKKQDDSSVQETNKVLHKDEQNGIAPKLGIKFPGNPNLSYLYPPPNITILTNIAHTLACVPKFYVQVLHLMNRMNLPAPFGLVTPVPPILGQTQSGTVSESSEESEMESDSDEKEKRAKAKPSQIKVMPETLSKKRVKLKPAKVPLSKKLKLSTSTKQDSVEIAFEHTSQQPRKIEFNLTEAITSIFDSGPPQLDSMIQSQSTVVEGFGKFEPQPEAVTMETVEDEPPLDDTDEFISLRELDSNRMSEKELRTMSALKNYSIGDPTSRLYVKNLAKQVEDKDLHYIFGRYVDFASEEEKDRFDIRHMKEGRMKGQAFITLPSESQAKRALHEVHGYILQGRPLVIQYARSAKAKETS